MDAKYELIEIDWNDNDITDNDGASTYKDAVAEAVRMCKRETTKNVLIEEIEEDGAEGFPVAYVSAVNDDEDDLYHSERDTLRGALFGQEEADAEDEMENYCVSEAMDAISEAYGVLDGPLRSRFLVSDEPVVNCYGFVDVYSWKAVEKALRRVFREEVEKFRQEQDEEVE
jgi:hypothetical protein